MPSEFSPDVKFEIGHVLFIDIVGYSKLLINEQSDQIQKTKGDRARNRADPLGRSGRQIVTATDWGRWRAFFGTIRKRQCFVSSRSARRSRVIRNSRSEWQSTADR